MRNIKIYGVPYFNFRRVYELIRNEKPHLVIISHNDAFENLNLLETVVQVARSWRHGDISLDGGYFPVILVGSGEGERDSVKRLLIHLKWVIGEKIDGNSISSFNKALTSETVITRFKNRKLLRATSHLLVGVDEGLLNEIGAISDSLFSEDASVEFHLCFGKSEAPGAMLRVMAALGGYKIIESDFPSPALVPDFHVCGASRPSALPEADIFYFEGNAKLVELSGHKLPGIPPNTAILTIFDTPKIAGAKKESLERVRKNINKIMNRIGNLNKCTGCEDCTLKSEECAHHVICPINLYSHFLLTKNANIKAIEKTTRRGFILNRIGEPQTNQFEQKVLETSEAYIAVCGSNSEFPGSMAIMLAKLLRVRLQVAVKPRNPVVNVFFTKSQTCAGGREYKRIIGIVSNQTPANPREDILNGLIVITHKQGAEKWREYIKNILETDEFEEIEGNGTNESMLTAFVYFSTHCKVCPYFPARSPRPQLCKIWHPLIKDKKLRKLPIIFEIKL